MSFLKKILGSLGGRRLTKVNPKRFDDPLALKISWKPASYGGRTFVERKLVETDPMKMEFVATFYAKLLSIFLIVAGAGLFGYSLYQEYVTHNLVTIEKLTTYIKKDFWNKDSILLTVLGAIMLYMGYSMLKRFLKTTLFDKYTNQFTIKGSERSIYDIHAIQIISEHISSKNSSYYSYELNLVLKDEERINIIDNNNLNLVRTNGRKLSRFLNVPLWDGGR